ncbi:hypothetical protein D3C87_1834380 [compost metagenome]
MVQMIVANDDLIHRQPTPVKKGDDIARGRAARPPTGSSIVQYRAAILFNHHGQAMTNIEHIYAPAI